MVEEQIIRRDISDKRLIEAFRRVPRHEFVLNKDMGSSYEDYPLGIEEGQTISQPYIAALMTQSLNLTADDEVLEIGTGSGYQTALLAELAKEIYSVERLDTLACRAKEILKKLGYNNIHIRTDDGTLGWPEEKQFDAIIVTAASPSVPQSLLKQLKDKGRMVIPVGDKFSQKLVLVTKTGPLIKQGEICSCVFVPLVGKFGWN